MTFDFFFIFMDTWYIYVILTSNVHKKIIVKFS